RYDLVYAAAQFGEYRSPRTRRRRSEAAQTTRRNNMRTNQFAKTIAALVASTLSAGAALAAEGEYYEGASPHAVRSIDSQVTNSIAERTCGWPVSAKSTRPVRQPTSRDNRRTGGDRINSGDYYSGASRPN